MIRLVEVVITNALAAGFLAAVAWAVARRRHQPALVHALWAVALLRLVAPPFVPLEWLPRPSFLEAPSQSVETAVRAGVLGREVATPLVPPAVASSEFDAPSAARLGVADPGRVPSSSARFGWPLFAAVVIGVGALALLAIGFVRHRRLRRLLATAEPADAEMSAAAVRLAGRLGLRRTPLVTIVDARLSPLVVSGRGGARIVWPRALLSRVTAAERDTLLAHELAHVRRRDHWMRWIEWFATALFWWYPVAWWTRRAMRAAEERCCDEWVARVLPESRRCYAGALVKTVDFLAGADADECAMASAVSPARDLRRRLEEVLMNEARPAPSRIARALLALAALVALGSYPTWASPAVGAQQDEPEVAAPASPAIAVEVAPLPPAPPAFETAPVRAAAPPALPPLAVAPALAPAPPEPEPPAMTDEEDEDRFERSKLRETRRALERELRELHERERQMERRRVARELDARVAVASERLEAARGDGDAHRVSRLEREIAALEARRAVLRERLQAPAEESASAERFETLERRRRDLEAAGRCDEAAALGEQMDALVQARRADELQRAEREAQLEARAMEAELALQGIEAERMVEAHEREVARLNREVERRREEIARAAEARRRELEFENERLNALRLEQQARALAQRGDDVAAEAAAQAAREAHARIQARASELRAMHRDVEQRQLATELERQLERLEEARLTGSSEHVEALERAIAELRARVDGGARGEH